MSQSALMLVKLRVQGLAPERFAIPVRCFLTTSPDALSFVLRNEPHFCRNDQTSDRAEAAAPTACKQLVPRRTERI